jgi:hypothetical protein
VIDLDEARRTAPAPRSVRISPLAGVAVAVGVLVVGGGVSAVALGGIGNGIERVASVWSDEPAVTTDELQDRLREARRALEAGQLQRADQLVSDVVTQAARLDPADERRVREEAAEVRRSLADARRRAASRTTRTDANGRSPARESPAGRVEPAGGPTTAPRSPTDGPGVGGSVAAGKVTGTFGATDAGGVRGTGTLGVGTDGASLTGRATVPVADGVTVTLRATLTSDPSGSISGSLDTVDDTVDDRVGGSAGHRPAGKPDRRP